MRDFLVRISVNGHSFNVCVCAQTKWEAVERLMYQHGWASKQPDRTKYVVR